MATATQAADAVGDINVDWDSADELDEVLKNLDGVLHAVAEKFQVIADKVDETALKPEYKESIAERVAGLRNEADKLAEVIAGGVLYG